MDVLVVYGTKFGNTRRVAEVIGAAMRPAHEVVVEDVETARDRFGTEYDLLIVGVPTQVHGWRLMGRPFLDGLARHAFAGLPAAAFDTRLPGPVSRTGSASGSIARKLAAAGCRVVVPPESFLVAGNEGPLVPGEAARAAAWAGAVLAAAGPVRA